MSQSIIRNIANAMCEEYRTCDQKELPADQLYSQHLNDAKRIKRALCELNDNDFLIEATWLKTQLDHPAWTMPEANMRGFIYEQIQWRISAAQLRATIPKVGESPTATHESQ